MMKKKRKNLTKKFVAHIQSYYRWNHTTENILQFKRDASMPKRLCHEEENTEEVNA